LCFDEKKDIPETVSGPISAMEVDASASTTGVTDKVTVTWLLVAPARVTAPSLTQGAAISAR